MLLLVHSFDTRSDNVFFKFEASNGEIMAVRFASPVSNGAEASLHAGAIPMNTKATTDWGICVLSAHYLI